MIVTFDCISSLFLTNQTNTYNNTLIRPCIKWRKSFTEKVLSGSFTTQAFLKVWPEHGLNMARIRPEH